MRFDLRVTRTMFHTSSDRTSIFHVIYLDISVFGCLMYVRASLALQARGHRKFQVLQKFPGAQVLEKHVRRALQAKCLRKFQGHPKFPDIEVLDDVYVELSKRSASENSRSNRKFQVHQKFQIQRFWVAYS